MQGSESLSLFFIYLTQSFGGKQSFRPALALLRNHREKLSYVALHRRQKTFQVSHMCYLLKMTSFHTTTQSVCEGQAQS